MITNKDQSTHAKSALIIHTKEEKMGRVSFGLVTRPKRVMAVDMEVLRVVQQIFVSFACNGGNGR